MNQYNYNYYVQVSLDMPNDIIGILVFDVFDNIVERIKEGQGKDIFESGIFECKSCKFCLVIPKLEGSV